MIQNDWGFPSTQIVKVILHSSNTTTLLPKPSSVELKHFGVLQSPYTEKDVGQRALTSILPQSYFCILSKGSRSDEEGWEVRVNAETRICHETNPLGRLVVTLQKTMVPQAMTQSQQGPEGDVHFYFDLREEAHLFAAYLQAAQDRLRDMFVHGPMENEQIVYSLLFDVDYSLRAQAKGWKEFPIPAEDDTQAKIRFMLVSSQEGGEQRYRAIVSREGYAGAVCLDFKDKTPQISQRGLLKSLQDIEVWISDYDANGKSVVSQMSWEELTQRGTKSRSLRATFIKSENERTAGDWLDEADDLISAMRGDRKDPYERVKIAIIDSGLHDRERGHYRAEYKDFTGVPNNDSWHGTCCAGIIQGMYEEARLYIARVFERDHADEIEGPLRMARAIHWAIEPPCSVDIISISAGFRNYSKELDDAVTRAKAAGVLVIAAASNWQNTNTVAFPARHNLSTMCIYSTNTGNQSSSFNPEPRADTQNFAILGEGFQHPDQRRNERMSGTSMATAVAAGIAARIVDFSRQRDNRASIFRAQDLGI
ncbi:Minor extracellular protease Epr [Fusarium oxysporum f. sp. rapae]|uniref:Minor extracellular protease Epr n=1 Tax=Fusarium oxysporum f. sp. rapae TaxID=485398 RepID=A0A8J5P1X9_FUSOX|nr:Minor extracellular protease Epr [Fusarium oxysporum f. sp. rapae]